MSTRRSAGIGCLQYVAVAERDLQPGVGVRIHTIGGVHGLCQRGGQGDLSKLPPCAPGVRTLAVVQRIADGVVGDRLSLLHLMNLYKAQSIRLGL